MGRWIIPVIEGKIDFAEPSLREHNQPGNGMPSDSDVINQILRTSLSSWRLQCKNHAIKRAQCSELGITARSSSHPLSTNQCFGSRKTSRPSYQYPNQTHTYRHGRRREPHEWIWQTEVRPHLPHALVPIQLQHASLSLSIQHNATGTMKRCEASNILL